MADGVRQPCRKCEYQDQKRYNEAHKKENNQAKMAWKRRNPDFVREDGNRYQRENPAKRNANHSRWCRKNPAKVNAYSKKRKAAKRRATVPWSIDFFVQEAYDLARRRTIATGCRWEVDHIVPLRSKLVCGLHAHTNVRVIPAAENYAKRNYHWPDMP